MGICNRYKPKNVRIDKNNPGALGVCDFSGFTFNHKDLIRQMDWRGDRQVWTGYLVGPQYLDVSNQQVRPPPIKPDPVPVEYARIPQQGPLAPAFNPSPTNPPDPPPYTNYDAPRAPSYNVILESLGNAIWSMQNPIPPS